MSRRIFVTGATGFLGSALLRNLSRHEYELWALARESSDRSGLADLDVRWLTGDLLDKDSLVSALAAIDGPFDVIHSGALISYDRRDREPQERINLDGTRNLLEACRNRSLRRFVHISSVVAVAHSDSKTPADETATFNGHGLGVDYVRTKRGAEEVALSYLDDVDVVVTCPAAIFGPTQRATSNSARLLSEVKSGRSFPAAPPGGVTVVGVEDVAEGCRLALEKGRRGERYILGESYWTVRELLSFLSSELGGHPVKRTVPGSIWNVAVLAVRVMDACFPMKYVTPQSLSMLGLHWNLDSQKARRELGWTPEPAADILRRALQSTP